MSKANTTGAAIAHHHQELQACNDIPLDTLTDYFGLTYKVLRRKVLKHEIRLPTFRSHAGRKGKLLVSAKDFERYQKSRGKEAF